MASRIPFLILISFSSAVDLDAPFVASFVASFVPDAGSFSTVVVLSSGVLCAVGSGGVVPAASGSSVAGSGLIGAVLGSGLVFGAGATSAVSHESRIECSLFFKSSAARLMT